MARLLWIASIHLQARRFAARDDTAGVFAGGWATLGLIQVGPARVWRFSRLGIKSGAGVGDAALSPGGSASGSLLGDTNAKGIAIMGTFNWEHIHLRSPDPEATARWYQDMLEAEVIRTPQPDGGTRIDLNLGGGQKVFIASASPDSATSAAPQTPYFGLEHIGLTVNDIDAAVTELKRKGVVFTTDPKTVRPGVRIAFMRGPENVLIELIQRG